jgi:hypothetical protein
VQEDISPFIDLYNRDGSKITRISDLKQNIIILIGTDEEVLLKAIVRKYGYEGEKDKRGANDMVDYRSVIQSASNKWYDSNMETWKYKSQQVISNQNIQKYMNMYRKTLNVSKDEHPINNQ